MPSSHLTLCRLLTCRGLCVGERLGLLGFAGASKVHGVSLSALCSLRASEALSVKKGLAPGTLPSASCRVVQAGVAAALAPSSSSSSSFLSKGGKWSVTT